MRLKRRVQIQRRRQIQWREQQQRRRQRQLRPPKKEKAGGRYKFKSKFNSEFKSKFETSGRRGGETPALRPQRQLQAADAPEIVASWGAALRTGAAGSQDESRRCAIHKQRPYPAEYRS
jgi:hypothetical protein